MGTGVPSIRATAVIDGVVKDVKLFWREQGPFVRVENRAIKPEFVEILEKIIPVAGGVSKTVTLKKPVRVYLDPVFTVWHPYVKQGYAPDLYPKSSEGWARRHTGTWSIGLYAVFRTNTDRFWMNVLDHKYQIHEAHSIEEYEISLIRMEEDWLRYLRRIETALLSDSKSLRADVLSILEGSPPTWEEFAQLVRGADVQEPRIEKTLRATLDHMVPKEFPPEAREEWMAFLAWMIRGAPVKDPIQFFHRLGFTNLFRELALRHMQCILDQQPVPSYLQILKDASLQRLQLPWIYQQDVKSMPWVIALQRIKDITPNWRWRTLKYVKRLRKSELVKIEFPVSKKEATKDKEKYKDRLALVVEGFHLKTFLNPQAVGLVGVISLSPAYRWPHKHIAWSAGMKSLWKNLQHVQFMVVPPPSVESISRELGNIVEVGWLSCAVNPSLFVRKKNAWENRKTRIISSLMRPKDIRALRKEFGGWNGKSVSVLDKEEIRVIDATSNNFYLSMVETKGFEKSFGFTPKTLEERLNKLHKRNIINLAFRINFVDLVSVLFSISGEKKNVCALTRGLMKHTPFSLGFVSPDAEKSVVIAKLPVDDVPYYIERFPHEINNMEELTVKTARIFAFRAYQHDLLERLLKDDDTWDGDISSLLKQKYRFRIRTREKRVD